MGENDQEKMQEWNLLFEENKIIFLQSDKKGANIGTIDLLKWRWSKINIS